MNDGDRILLLGLDAADHGIIQTLMRDGRMPHLAGLARRGVTGRLASPADLYAGGVWPTFYTGQPVERHGVFHNKQWRPEKMRVEVPTVAWTAARPFWEEWQGSGIESLLIDVPMVLGRPRPLDGVYLGGWGTHDLICRGSWPRPLWADLERRFGPPVMPREEFGWQTEESLARLQETLRRATAQVRDLATHLMARQPWRFACIVFGALHRGGHYLWDRSQAGPGRPDDCCSQEPSDALIDLYAGVDQAIGEILARVPGRTLVMAFAVHGMGANPGWSDLMPELLARLDECRTGRTARRGALYRLRQTLPHHWLRPLLTRLPLPVTQRLVEAWSSRMFDWSRTRYFPVPMDEAGYLRVNLQGRERAGIVAAGRDYDGLCQELESLVASLRDETTGRPIAGPVVHAYRDAGSAASCRRLLPDLIVPWTGTSAAQTRCVVSTLLPEFRFDVARRLPSGRSGNHREHGWFIAAGDGVVADPAIRDHRVIDLLPTVLKRLGLRIDPRLPGCPIPGICGP